MEKLNWTFLGSVLAGGVFFSTGLDLGMAPVPPEEEEVLVAPFLGRATRGAPGAVGLTFWYT